MPYQKETKMIKIETDPYFEFLCSIVSDDDFDPSQYKTLMSRLHQEEFTWIIPEDANRAADGYDLRLEFWEMIGKTRLDSKLENTAPCTVLEMMVALARRCEIEIMEDLDVGRRVGRWFKLMLRSLGLKHERDDYYDEGYVNYIISSFLQREYEPNGDGGLFLINNPEVDMRAIEIWYQMHTYLCNIEAW